MKVLVLVGSLRADSFNALLATAARRHLPADADVTTWPRIGELPFYSEDLEATGPGPVVEELRRAVAAADALVIATPEYNGSVSAVLKNAVDWSSRPRGTASIAGKPVAVIAASGSPRAAQWAREDLVRILKVAGAHPLESTVGGGSAYELFVGGELVDGTVDRALYDLMTDLMTWESAPV